MARRVVRARDQVGNLTEAAWQAQVIGLARINGWTRIYHAPNGGHGGRIVPGQIPEGRGFPDLIMVRGNEAIVAELKTDKGRIGPGQAEWLEAFAETGIDAYLWRPRDIDQVQERLGRAHAASVDLRNAA